MCAGRRPWRRAARTTTATRLITTATTTIASTIGGALRLRQREPLDVAGVGAQRARAATRREVEPDERRSSRPARARAATRRRATTSAPATRRATAQTRRRRCASRWRRPRLRRVVTGRAAATARARGHAAPRIIRRCIRPPCSRRDRARASRAALRASGRSRRRRLLSRAARARRARSPRPRRRRLRAAAQAAALAPPGELGDGGRGEIERRLALLAWQGNAGVLRAALDERERDWLRALPRVRPRRACPSALRHNLPEWLAAPLQAAPRRRVLALGRSDRRAGAARPARQRAQGRPRRRSSSALARAGIEAAPTPYSPLGIRVAGKPALQKSRRLRAGAGRGAGRGQPAARARSSAPGAARWWSTSAPAPAARRSRSAPRCATPAACTRSTSRAIGSPRCKPRLARSGLGNVHPAQIAHERDDRVERLAGKVDRVLVDAPCSGSGTLRRNPDLKWRQSGESLAALAADRSAAILGAAARLVKPGGRLVYATCSVLDAEGEAVAADFDAATAASSLACAFRPRRAASERRSPPRRRWSRAIGPAPVDASPCNRRFLRRALAASLEAERDRPIVRTA